jgi:hypothetical protein
MQEAKVREVIGQSLPKILSMAAKGLYPMTFQAQAFTPKESRVNAPIASSQLAYTGNWQILSFLHMDPGHIVKLGTMAFPKKSRSDIPKLVLSANGELLNAASARLGLLLGKLDQGAEVAMTPPLAANFTGANSVDVSPREAFFFRLSHGDIALTFVSSIQMV